jgi:hypothetical protein
MLKEFSFLELSTTLWLTAGAPSGKTHDIRQRRSELFDRAFLGRVSSELIPTQSYFDFSFLFRSEKVNSQRHTSTKKDAVQLMK